MFYLVCDVIIRNTINFLLAIDMDWKEEFVEKMFLNDDKYDEAISLKRDNLPESLFRYRELDCRNIDSFKKDKVWLSEPSKFNDPYDCLLAALINSRELVSELLEKQENGIYSEFLKGIPKQIPAEDANKVREIQKGSIEQILGRLRDMYHICCFSECNDSMLMWSHYANKHKGFCIEYAVNPEPKDLVSQYLYPVLYTPRLYDNTAKVFSRWEKDPNSYNEFQNYFALIKFSDWSYEKEWRLIYPYTKEREDPPLKGISPTQTQKMIAKAIYLGCKVEKDSCYYECLSEVASAKQIDIYQMELSKDEFKIVPKLISSGRK